MSDLQGLLERLVRILDEAGVPFMVAGSFASATHGMPRPTQDLDIVIDPPDITAVDALVHAFPPDEYYVDADAARDAMRRRSMFNVVDQATGWKVDFIFRKNRAFSREEFARRVLVTMVGVGVYAASAEDTIIAKLEWSLLSGGSERQRRDVAGILATMGDELDVAHIERWVEELGLQEEWGAAKETAL
jgi:hypothetical protein